MTMNVVIKTVNPIFSQQRKFKTCKTTTHKRKITAHNRQKLFKIHLTETELQNKDF